MRWKAFKAALLLLPLAWLALVMTLVRLTAASEGYSRMWWEHHEAAQNKDGLSKSGDTVSALFEYMCSAQRGYLDDLVLVLIVGILPAIAVYFWVAMYKTLR